MNVELKVELKVDPDSHVELESSCRPTPPRQTRFADRSPLTHRLCFALLSLLLVLQINPGYGQDQTGAATSKEVRGVVSDSENKPASGLVMDFWLAEQKLGSATSDDSGAFTVKLELGESAAQSVVKVSSAQGHSQFSLSEDIESLVLQLSKSESQSATPTWLFAFFATILPIVVIAIVIMAIRNRRTTKPSG